MRIVSTLICGCAIIAAVHISFTIVAWSRGLCDPWVIAILSPLFIPLVLYLCIFSGVAVAEHFRTTNRRRNRWF